jgi:hypothetical protein
MKSRKTSKRRNTPKVKVTGATKVDGYGQGGKCAKHFKEIANLKDQEDELNNKSKFK